MIEREPRIAFHIAEYFGGPHVRERVFGEARRFASETGMMCHERLAPDGSVVGVTLMLGIDAPPASREEIDFDASCDRLEDFSRWQRAINSTPKG